jgi:hypothetical protein
MGETYGATDMSKLQALHDLLLDKSRWPDGFKWDYQLNTQCAIGLAEQTGLVARAEAFYPAAFDLDGIAFERIFRRAAGAENNPASWAKVTPAVVARRIKRHLKAQAHEGVE